MKKKRKNLIENIDNLVFGENKKTKYIFFIIGTIIGAIIGITTLIDKPSIPTTNEQTQYIAIAQHLANNDLEGARAEMDKAGQLLEIKIDSSKVAFHHRGSTKYGIVINYSEDPTQIAINKSDGMIMYILEIASCAIIGFCITWFIYIVVEALFVFVLVIHLIYQGIKYLIKKIMKCIKKSN